MNILMFTTQYPNPKWENKQTLANHYFAREWCKAGHRVIVVHNGVLIAPGVTVALAKAIEEYILMDDDTRT